MARSRTKPAADVPMAMAKRRVRGEVVDVVIKSRDAASIPTGGNPYEDGDVGGLVPNPTKNIVVELCPGAVVERVDDLNWQSKVLRPTSTKRAGREAKCTMKWEGIGYYSSPGYAVRKTVQQVLGQTPARLTLEELADHIDRLIHVMTPSAIAGERAKALDEAAIMMHDERDAEALRQLARQYIASADALLTSTQEAAQELIKRAR